MKVKLQLALDVLTLSEAQALARAAGPYADWIEAGTVLIKSEGIRVVSELKSLFPDKPLLADMKVMDGGAVEATLAFDAGADIITACAAASNATLQAVWEVASEKNGLVMVDLLGATDAAARAQQVEAIGAHYLCVHRPSDVGVSQAIAGEVLRLTSAASLPIAVAGSIRLDNLSEPLRAGASIVIVGSAITRADDPAQAARAFRDALEAGIE